MIHLIPIHGKQYYLLLCEKKIVKNMKQKIKIDSCKKTQANKNLYIQNLIKNVLLCSLRQNLHLNIFKKISLSHKLPSNNFKKISFKYFQKISLDQTVASNIL